MRLTIAHITPLIAVFAGILILLMRRLLNYILAIHLIVVGLVTSGADPVIRSTVQEKPRRRWGRWRGLTGGAHRRADVLTEPSVRTKMTHRQKIVRGRLPDILNEPI